MIDVSIIVPTYNRSKYIGNCIDSLINQTHKNIEIIIVDDGSSDNTKELVKKYKDKRIKYFYKENTGIGDTRNYGIRKSNGEYLCFVDSDDYIDKTMIEKCFNKAEKDNLDIVICDYIEIYEDTKNEVKFNLDNFKNTTLKNNPDLILNTNLGPCNKLIKRNLFDNDLFPTDIKYEDMALMIKVMKKAKKIGKINEYLSYFNVHSNSETTTVDNKVFDIFVSLDMIKDTLKEDAYKEALNKLIVRKLTIYTIQQRNQKSKNNRKEFVDKAFAYLKENVPDYKDNKYYKDRGILRRTIEKNKLITKIYINTYYHLKN